MLSFSLSFGGALHFIVQRAPRDEDPAALAAAPAGSNVVASGTVNVTAVGAAKSSGGAAQRTAEEPTSAAGGGSASLLCLKVDGMGCTACTAKVQSAP